MGSHLYSYFTPYHDDLDAALQALREKEFRAGHYDPALFGTAQPSRDLVESAVLKNKGPKADAVYGILEHVPRGQARYIIVFAGGVPSEIFFLGYSWD